MNSNFEQNRKEIYSIMKADPSNKVCVDCRTIGTNFVDVKIGCFLCIKCAGIHRQFGTDVCRVKSINLDNFSTEELSMFTFTRGNAYVNKIYEGKIDKYNNIIGTSIKVPIPNNKTDEIYVRDFIKRKYITKEFYLENQNITSQNITNETTQQTTLKPNLSKSTSKVNIKINPLPAPPNKNIKNTHNNITTTTPIQTTLKPTDEDLIFFDQIPNQSNFADFSKFNNNNNNNNNNKINEILSLYNYQPNTTSNNNMMYNY